MSLSEFRFNKKRKHYAYLFKQIGLFRKNILFTSKPIRIWKGKTRILSYLSIQTIIALRKYMLYQLFILIMLILFIPVV